MKHLIAFTVLMAFLTTVLPAVAQIQDLEIKASRVRLDRSKQRGAMETVTNTQVAYKVTLKNKTFQPLPEVTVKYIIFYAEARPGSTEEPVTSQLKGSKVLKDIRANGKVEFETMPLTLSKSELDGNVVWTSGASGRTKDDVLGVWFRAYVNGEMKAEYINPSTLSKKNNWKE